MRFEHGIEAADLGVPHKLIIPGDFVFREKPPMKKIPDKLQLKLVMLRSHGAIRQ